MALACGAVAGIAFSFTTGKGDSLIDSVLGLKQSNDYLRGLCVGLTMLVLIRSKLSSIKGAVFVESQIKNVQQSKPQVAFDPARLDWQTYYRTLTNLALDYAGKAVFEGWTQFD